MHLITGATGHTGHRLAFGLLSKGEQVRILGRNADRMKQLAQKGADVYMGSLEDAETVKKIFRGVKTAYLMIPPHPTAPDFRGYQRRIVENFVVALKESSIQHIVTLSSIGAHLSEKTGPIVGLHQMEQALNEFKDRHIVHLRPCYFMENLLYMIPVINHVGSLGSAINGELPLDMICTRDITTVAEQYLTTTKDWSGHKTRDLLGLKSWTMNDVAKILGPAIGKKDLKYKMFSYEDAEASMLKAGMSPSVTKDMVELSKAFNEGLLPAAKDRTKENTTPTTLQNFAKQFAEAFKA